MEAKDRVRKFLDLSTEHLPEAFFEEDSGGLWGDGAVVHSIESLGLGWDASTIALLWVPDDPYESAAATQVDPRVLKIQMLAKTSRPR